MTDKADNIVKPTDLAKELDIAPQVIFGWIRRDLVPHHECVCGHKYLVRDEIQEFLDRRAAKLVEEQERIAKELAGEAS